MGDRNGGPIPHTTGGQKVQTTWSDSTDAYLNGIVGLCLTPQRKWFIWRLPMGETTKKHLIEEENPEVTGQ